MDLIQEWARSLHWWLQWWAWGLAVDWAHWLAQLPHRVLQAVQAMDPMTQGVALLGIMLVAISFGTRRLRRLPRAPEFTRTAKQAAAHMRRPPTLPAMPPPPFTFPARCYPEIDTSALNPLAVVHAMATPCGVTVADPCKPVPRLPNWTPSPDNEEPVNAFTLWCISNFSRIPYKDRRRLIAVLQAQLPRKLIMKFRDQVKRGKIIGSDTPGFHHLGGGMAIRNILRLVIADSDLPETQYPGYPMGCGWDDYYMGALYALVADVNARAERRRNGTRAKRVEQLTVTK